MDSTTTFVIAGSYHEYLAFLKEKQLPRDTAEYTFFSDPMHLLSLHNTPILCVGQYWKSPVLKHEYSDYYASTHNIQFVNILGEEI
jgi:hypothetical protein